MLTTVIVVFASAALEAQNRRFNPAGSYAVEIDGAPSVLSLQIVRNVTAGRPSQPDEPSGLLEEEGIYLASNNCVSQPHHVGPGQGVWRVDPGTSRRSAVGVTIHAAIDPAGPALGFTFQQITWTFKFARASGGVMGGARVDNFDSLDNLRAGKPTCSSFSMDVLRDLPVVVAAVDGAAPGAPAGPGVMGARRSQ
jgi:hypothetical protein